MVFDKEEYWKKRQETVIFNKAWLEWRKKSEIELGASFVRLNSKFFTQKNFSLFLEYEKLEASKPVDPIITTAATDGGVVVETPHQVEKDLSKEVV